jgi:hypothetical protein
LAVDQGLRAEAVQQLRERLEQRLPVTWIGHQPCISKATNEATAVLLGGLECPEIV